MPVHNPTLTELVGSGYVEIDVYCRTCRGLVCLNLVSMMHARGHETTIKEIEGKLRCRRCGNRPTSVKATFPSRHGGYGA